MVEEEQKIKANIKIIFKEDFKNKIEWFVNNYKEEISGWIVGKIEEEIILEDLLIPYQEVSSGSVDTTNGDLVKLRKEYGDRCKDIIGHWHSHNTMSSFWSGTDEEFITQHMKDRAIRIFVVSSVKDGHRIRLEIRKPFNVSLDCLDYEEEETNPKLGKELLKEIEKKVKKKEYTYSQNVVYTSGWQRDMEDRYYTYPYEKDYGKNLNTRFTKEEEKIIDSTIVNKVDAMVSYNKSMFNVTIIGLDNDYFEELIKYYEKYKMNTIKGFGGGKNSISFTLSSRKETKKLFRDVKDHLFALFRDEESLNELKEESQKEKQRLVDYGYY